LQAQQCHKLTNYKALFWIHAYDSQLEKTGKNNSREGISVIISLIFAEARRVVPVAASTIARLHNRPAEVAEEIKQLLMRVLQGDLLQNSRTDKKGISIQHSTIVSRWTRK
jgi:hypothetical protein